MKTLITAIAILAMTASYAQTGHAPKHKFTATQAKTVALKKYKGNVVGKVVLENEEGKWQYAVMVRSGKTLHEVMVGADSGKIENVEVTTAGKEAKELATEKAKTAPKGHDKR